MADIVLINRLANEGRLDKDDSYRLGINFEPAQMTREELSEGYVRLMDDLYQPEAFFERVDALYVDANFKYASHKIDYWRRKPWQWLKRMGYASVFFIGSLFLLLSRVKDTRLRRIYRRRLLRLMWKRWSPELWFIYVLKCAGHYHFYLLTQEMKKQGAINHGTDEPYHGLAPVPVKA